MKTILTAIAVALSAFVQPALANYTYDKNGEPTHYKGIPLPPVQTVEEARAATEKRIAAIKAEEARQAEQAATSSNLQSEIGDHQWFFTGKPYLEETGRYLFLFRHYDPELARWTTADPSGFPDWPNNYLYSPDPLSGLDPDGLAWGILDYAWHYVFGGGSPVTLSQIGHLSSVKAHFSFQGAIQRFGDQLDSIAAGLTPFNGTLNYWTQRSYDFHNASYPIGSAMVTGVFSGPMSSTPNYSGSGGTWQYSGNASFTFNDLFQDPFDIIETFYNNDYSSAPSWIIGFISDGLGTPFFITGDWTHPFSGSGVYE
jgi:RHS repeat-associated protein